MGYIENQAMAGASPLDAAFTPHPVDAIDVELAQEGLAQEGLGDCHPRSEIQRLMVDANRVLSSRGSSIRLGLLRTGRSLFFFRHRRDGNGTYRLTLDAAREILARDEKIRWRGSELKGARAIIEKGSDALRRGASSTATPPRSDVESPTLFPFPAPAPTSTFAPTPAPPPAVVHAKNMEPIAHPSRRPQSSEGSQTASSRNHKRLRYSEPVAIAGRCTAKRPSPSKITTLTAIERAALTWLRQGSDRGFESKARNGLHAASRQGQAISAKDVASWEVELVTTAIIDRFAKEGILMKVARPRVVSQTRRVLEEVILNPEFTQVCDELLALPSPEAVTLTVTAPAQGARRAIPHREAAPLRRQVSKPLPPEAIVPPSLLSAPMSAQDVLVLSWLIGSENSFRVRRDSLKGTPLHALSPDNSAQAVESRSLRRLRMLGLVLKHSYQGQNRAVRDDLYLLNPEYSSDVREFLSSIDAVPAAPTVIDAPTEEIISIDFDAPTEEIAPIIRSIPESVVDIIPTPDVLPTILLPSPERCAIPQDIRRPKLSPEKFSDVALKVMAWLVFESHGLAVIEYRGGQPEIHLIVLTADEQKWRASDTDELGDPLPNPLRSASSVYRGAALESWDLPVGVLRNIPSKVLRDLRLLEIVRTVKNSPPVNSAYGKAAELVRIKSDAVRQDVYHLLMYTGMLPDQPLGWEPRTITMSGSEHESVVTDVESRRSGEVIVTTEMVEVNPVEEPATPIEWTPSVGSFTFVGPGGPSVCQQCGRAIPDESVLLAWNTTKGPLPEGYPDGPYTFGLTCAARLLGVPSYVGTTDELGRDQVWATVIRAKWRVPTFQIFAFSTGDAATLALALPFAPTPDLGEELLARGFVPVATKQLLGGVRYTKVAARQRDVDWLADELAAVYYLGAGTRVETGGVNYVEAVTTILGGLRRRMRAQLALAQIDYTGLAQIPLDTLGLRSMHEYTRFMVGSDVPDEAAAGIIETAARFQKMFVLQALTDYYEESTTHQDAAYYRGAPALDFAEDFEPDSTTPGIHWDSAVPRVDAPRSQALPDIEAIDPLRSARDVESHHKLMEEVAADAEIVDAIDAVDAIVESAKQEIEDVAADVLEEVIEEDDDLGVRLPDEIFLPERERLAAAHAEYDAASEVFRLACIRATPEERRAAGEIWQVARNTFMNAIEESNARLNTEALRLEEEKAFEEGRRQRRMREEGQRAKLAALMTEMDARTKEVLSPAPTEVPIETHIIERPEPPSSPKTPTVLPPLEMAMGEEATVRTSAEKIPVRYAIVRLNDLIPSHDPRTWRLRPEYPSACQQRAYEDEPTERAKVAKIAQELDPRTIISDTTSPLDGPPIITPSGIVLGGNGRTMAMILADGDEMAAYQQRLQSSAGYFGINIDAFRDSIDAKGVNLALVRVADIDINRCAYYSNIFNTGETQGITTGQKAVSLNRQLTDRDVEDIAARFDVTDGETLKAIMDSSSFAVFIIRRLRNAGIITDANAPEWVDGGVLSKRGRDDLEGVLLARILGSVKVSTSVPSYTQMVLLNIPAILSSAALGPEWDLRESLIAAIKLESDRRAQGSKVTKAEARAQGSVFETESISEMTRLVSDALDLKSRLFSKVIRRYAAIGKEQVKAEGDALFPVTPKTPVEVLQDLVGRATMNPSSLGDGLDGLCDCPICGLHDVDGFAAEEGSCGCLDAEHYPLTASTEPTEGLSDEPAAAAAPPVGVLVTETGFSPVWAFYGSQTMPEAWDGATLDLDAEPPPKAVLALLEALEAAGEMDAAEEVRQPKQKGVWHNAAGGEQVISGSSSAPLFTVLNSPAISRIMRAPRSEAAVMFTAALRERGYAGVRYESPGGVTYLMFSPDAVIAPSGLSDGNVETSMRISASAMRPGDVILSPAGAVWQLQQKWVEADGTILLHLISLTDGGAWHPEPFAPDVTFRLVRMSGAVPVDGLSDDFDAEMPLPNGFTPPVPGSPHVTTEPQEATKPQGAVTESEVEEEGTPDQTEDEKTVSAIVDGLAPLTGEVLPIDISAQEDDDTGFPETPTGSTGPVVRSLSDVRDIVVRRRKISPTFRVLFGNIPTRVLIFAHGLPGSGKSTLGMIFLNEIAQQEADRGKKCLIFNSEQPSTSGGMTDRAKRINARAPSIDVVDSSEFEDLISLLRSGQYSFVLLDSISKMSGKNDKERGARLLGLYKEFPDVSFFVIAHEGKDGRYYKGSSDLAHDTEVQIKVDSGLATTLKSHYGIGGPYRIFTPTPR